MPTKPNSSKPTTPAVSVGDAPLNLKRNRPAKDEEEEVRMPAPISAGPVDKVIELAFNPTHDKIREVTVIDRMQGRLFPLLDMIQSSRAYILEIAYYRQNKAAYKKMFKQDAPILPNSLDELLYRTAQWQKSVQGKNLDRAIDIALAETETRSGEEDDVGSGDPWKD